MDEPNTTPKGVVVDFDFTALDGATLLFETTKRLLAEIDSIPFDVQSEARYLAGNNVAAGLGAYFSVVKTKKTALKAAKDLEEAFGRALAESVAEAASRPGVASFVRTLADRGVRVVLATRADVELSGAAFSGLVGDNVTLQPFGSSIYGGMRWDAWRGACAANGLRNRTTLAVTGSGAGVKAALVAGMASLAVVSPHVAYQDFGGADATVECLDDAAAALALRLLRV